jgi:hypothetical protein
MTEFPFAFFDIRNIRKRKGAATKWVATIFIGLILLLVNSSAYGQSILTKTVVVDTEHQKLLDYKDNAKVFESDVVTKRLRKSAGSHGCVGLSKEDGKSTYSCALIGTRVQIIKRLSGKWKGTIYQNPGGVQLQYPFSMELEQVGKNVSGFSRFTAGTSSRYYGVMALEGTLIEDEFSFNDTRITEQKLPPKTSICIKSGMLRLTSQKGKLLLTGDWKSSHSAGQIKLEKVSNK